MRKRVKTGKFTSIWKLINTLLNNQWVKKETTREIRKYLEKKKIKSRHTKTFGTQ